MDLVEKWIAFLPAVEDMRPTDYCSITIGDMRELIGEYQAMRACVAELEAALAIFDPGFNSLPTSSGEKL